MSTTSSPRWAASTSALSRALASRMVTACMLEWSHSRESSSRDLAVDLAGERPPRDERDERAERGRA
jgi:hypothetical protein